jgi:hypothetical protein
LALAEIIPPSPATGDVPVLIESVDIFFPRFYIVINKQQEQDK